MAKKSEGVNKSEAVRQFLAKSKRAKPATVVAALAEQGITITAQYVSTIRSNARRKKGKNKRGENGGATTRPASDKVSLATLVQAKRLADQLGGVAKAKEALDALAKLQ